ncbi:hypothetical protein [Maricaulis salignorans]|uniref:Uncharacterized protein n=1 Tax=Maricaulis salignorans TaxID=144026 RepID=A0A1G9N210_9PROT|nr:hypothetical protein [Maricaulis salignorans]SDL80538.1 hypothetical protein SAMN04488568_102190 [Maricaulis salignorans]
MKHHRLSLTALAVAILTAGHALALQKASGEPASPRPHIAEMERFTASELMAELTRLAATTDGRVAFRDRDGLLERIQGRLDRLTTLADAQGGRWGTGFDIFLSTNDPAPRPCDDHTPVMVISRQGTELTGTACRLHTIQDGVPIVTLDQLLDAPFEGQTIHIHVVTNMAAERDSLLASGNEVLSAMATDILRALVLANPRSSGEDWLLWRDALQTLTDRADGFIHFNAPDTLAQAFAAAVTGILEATDVEETDWGFTFGVDGAQSFSDGGLFDTDRLATASRPETAAWCLPDVSFMATGPTGIDHTWHQCAGTPPDENPDTLIVRKIWTEERSSRVYRWLELTLFGSTETPDELPSVDRLTRELLALMANDVIIAPRAPAGSG